MMKTLNLFTFLPDKDQLRSGRDIILGVIYKAKIEILYLSMTICA